MQKSTTSKTTAQGQGLHQSGAQRRRDPTAAGHGQAEGRMGWPFGTNIKGPTERGPASTAAVGDGQPGELEPLPLSPISIHSFEAVEDLELGVDHSIALFSDIKPANEPEGAVTDGTGRLSRVGSAHRMALSFVPAHRPGTGSDRDDRTSRPSSGTIIAYRVLTPTRRNSELYAAAGAVLTAM